MSRRRPQARCRDCDSPIVWVTTAARGSRLALDASPDDQGTFQVLSAGHDGPIARDLAGGDLAAAVADGAALFTPHRRTCTANKTHNPCPPEARAILDRALGRAHREGTQQ